MKSKNLLLVILFVMFASINSKVFAQNGPVVYFCVKYDSEGDGEVDISDRFTTGAITVVVKSGSAIGLTDCFIQYDKYNQSKKKFEYYKKFEFEIGESSKYVYFAKTKNNDMAFEEPGIYRVYLLNAKEKVVSSSLVEIVERD